MEEFYCVFSFQTVNHALVFEKMIKEEGIEVKLMPMPRQISTSCGTAARVSCDMEDKIKEICEKLGIETEGFHKIVNKNENLWFTKFMNKKNKD